MTKYKTTRRQCFERIHGVCSRCGGPLSARRTVDNSGDPTFWAGCYGCSTFDWGAPAKLQRIAAQLAKAGHVAYASMDRPMREPRTVREHDYASYYRREQTSGLIYIVSEVLRLAKEGAHL